MRIQDMIHLLYNTIYIYIYIYKLIIKIMKGNNIFFINPIKTSNHCRNHLS
jgi:hypothetical protein